MSSVGFAGEKDFRQGSEEKQIFMMPDAVGGRSRLRYEKIGRVARRSNAN